MTFGLASARFVSTPGGGGGEGSPRLLFSRNLPRNTGEVRAGYDVVASSDPLALATSLIVNLVLFRFNAAQRLFGKYVQEQLYLVLMWALPLLSIATATAFVLVAMA